MRYETQQLTIYLYIGKLQELETNMHGNDYALMKHY